MGMSEHTLERQGHNHLGPRAARTGGEYKLLVAGCPQTYLTCDAVGPCNLQESCDLLLELHMPPSGRKPVDQNAVQATPVRYACQAPPNQISVEYYLQQGSTLLYACMSCTLHLSHEFRAHSCLWSYGHPTGHGKGGSAGVLHAHSCTTICAACGNGRGATQGTLSHLSQADKFGMLPATRESQALRPQHWRPSSAWQRKWKNSGTASEFLMVWSFRSAL